MRYMSLDIETTGLDPEIDQVLEIGAVIDDLKFPDRPVEELPTLQMFIRHERVSFHPEALGLHACGSGLLADYSTTPGIPPAVAVMELDRFWATYGTPGRIVVAGKTVAGFDLQFLKKMGLTSGHIHHRTLDPTIMFMRDGDVSPPSLETCRVRAGIGIETFGSSHRAVDDARNVIRVIRYARKMKGQL